MEAIVALSSAGGAVLVALVTTIGNIYVRKKDNVASRLSNIDNKLDLIGKGTQQSLKSDLQTLHDRQHTAVNGSKWNKDIDIIFIDTYKSYKDLGGNGVIDRLKNDVDLWRNRYADGEYKRETSQSEKYDV